MDWNVLQWLVVIICGVIAFLFGWLSGLYSKWQLESDSRKELQFAELVEGEDKVADLAREVRCLRESLEVTRETAVKNSAYLHFLMMRFDTKGAADVQS